MKPLTAILLALPLAVLAQPLPMAQPAAAETNERPAMMLAPVQITAQFGWNVSCTLSNAATNYSFPVKAFAVSTQSVWLTTASPTVFALRNEKGRPVYVTTVTPDLHTLGTFQASTNLVGTNWFAFNSATQRLAAPVRFVRAVSWPATNWLYADSIR